MGYRDDASGSLDGVPGFMIKKPQYPHRTITASWKEETQFRAWSAFINGRFQPLRFSTNERDFSDTVFTAPVVRCNGVHESFTYITRTPGMKDPTSTFYDGIMSLMKDKPTEVPPAWYQWAKQEGKTKAAKLQKPKPGLFMQGAAVMLNGKLFVDQLNRPHPQYPCIFMGTFSTKQEFERMADLLVENYSGPKPDSVVGDDDNARQQRDLIYGAMYALGDWASLERGRVLSVFKAPQRANERDHYSIAVKDVMPMVEIAEQIKKFWTPWNELLQFHTAEQQIGYICKGFPAEAVDYVFGASELAPALTQNVKGAWQRWLASRQAWTPGFAPGAAQPGYGMVAPGAAAPVVGPAVAPAQAPAPAPASAASMAPQGPPALPPGYVWATLPNGQVVSVPTAAIQPSQGIPAAPAAAPAAFVETPGGVTSAPMAPPMIPGAPAVNLSGGFGQLPQAAAAPAAAPAGTFTQATPPALQAAPVAVPTGSAPVVPQNELQQRLAALRDVRAKAGGQ